MSSLVFMNRDVPLYTPCHSANETRGQVNNLNYSMLIVDFLPYRLAAIKHTKAKDFACSGDETIKLGSLTKQPSKFEKALVGKQSWAMYGVKREIWS